MMSSEHSRQDEPSEGSREIIEEALKNSHPTELAESKLFLQNVGGVERVISAAVGIKLLMVTLKKMGIGGLLASGIAVSLLTRASTGHCAVKEQLAKL